MAIECFNEGIVLQSAWDSLEPSTQQDEGMARCADYTVLQEASDENDTSLTPNNGAQDIKGDPSTKLYTQAARRSGMTNAEYCTCMRSFNNEQCHIVMHSRASCKSAISSLRYGSRVNRYKIFLSGPGGTGKSHVIQMIKQDMTNMFKHTINPGDDQPIVLITAPTGSAVFQVGGSTIHDAFLLYDKTKTKVSYEKWTIMQLKFEKLLLSITDEISMVGFKQFHQIYETMCTVKGKCDDNSGNICVLAVGDLDQLPPVAQSPVYMTPYAVTTMSDNGP